MRLVSCEDPAAKVSANFLGDFRGVAMAPKVDFFFDIVCPYAYLASRRLPALVQARGAQLTWRPVLLGGLYAKTGAPQGAGGSASDAMPAAKQRVVAADLARCASAQGATLQEHQLTTRPSTLLAMRILTAAPAEAVPTLAAALFTAYWEQGRDLSSGEELARVVGEMVHGVDGDSLVASTDALAVKELLRRNTDDAHEKFGVFGVPAFAVGDVDPSHPLRGKALHDAEAAPPKRGNVLIYGQDRLDFVDALLDPNYSPDNSPKYSPSPLSPTPLLTPLPPTAPGARIELFHDFSSPWSYLGYTQVHLGTISAPSLCDLSDPSLLTLLSRHLGRISVARPSEPRRPPARHSCSGPSFSAPSSSRRAHT